MCYIGTMPTLQLFWLGPPRVEREGRPLRLETRKVTALLAWLSLERRPHSRESLAALLWPEYDSTRAPANLRRVLASLQASLGPGWLQADRDTVALGGPGEVRIDLEELRRRVREARAHHPGGGDPLCPTCERLLEEAAGLHRGDFLEGFNLKDCPAFDQWQLLQRDELLQQLGWALERLTAAAGEAGRWEAAVERARRWLALDELHEPAHRALMFLYARAGKRSAALRQYEECARLLREELDQVPDERTRALHERIRQRRLDSRAAGGSEAVPAAPAPPGAVPSSELRETRSVSSPSFGAVAADGLLQTRLRPPPIRPSRVQRARLLAALDEGVRRPLTLVSAPAGFGKTTLLAEWAGRCGLPVAWLSLEEGDNDPARFLTGLASALSAGEALQMLRSMQLPPLSAVVGSILADLARRPGGRVLVLDDFHFVTRPEIQQIAAQLAERLPPDFHMVIATRVDPALPLARLRARAQLAEVRADDLRFRPEEAAAFLRQVMGLDLGEEDVAVLERRTEGWAAGLQMAALSLQGRQDPSAFIRGFGGSHRYVMDYLVGEVLEGQPAEVQEFLLATSVLERFCAGLCDELTGRPGSQAVLDGLDRANLFLVPLDEERRWYRYHHLFAELLGHRLRLARPEEEIGRLHLRAGGWLERSGDPEGAMRHYLAGAHFGEALRLLEERHMWILAGGGLGLLLGWAGRLPAEEVRRSLGACVTLGTIYSWAGRPGEAERHFARADELLAGGPPSADPPPAVLGSAGTSDVLSAVPAARVRALRGIAASMRAFVADMAGDTDRAIELSRLGDELLPPEEPLIRALLPYILGKAYRYRGDLVRAQTWSADFLRRARATNNMWSTSGAIHELVWVQRLRGRLREADRLLDEFEALPRQAGQAGPVAKVLADRGELLRERNRLGEARRTIDQAVQDVERWGLPSDLYFCYLTRCRLRLSAGDPAGAAEDIARADEVARGSLVYTSMFPLLEAERVRVWLARGMTTEALDWVERYPLSGEGSPVNREVELTARARALRAGGRLPEALELLERLAAGAEAGSRTGRLIEILALLAATRAGADREKAARDALTRALELGEPEGYARVFLDEGEPVARLLGALAGAGAGSPRLRAFARRLIETLPS